MKIPKIFLKNKFTLQEQHMTFQKCHSVNTLITTYVKTLKILEKAVGRILDFIISQTKYTFTLND